VTAKAKNVCGLTNDIWSAASKLSLWHLLRSMESSGEKKEDDSGNWRKFNEGLCDSWFCSDVHSVCLGGVKMMRSTCSTCGSKKHPRQMWYSVIEEEVFCSKECYDKWVNSR